MLVPQSVPLGVKGHLEVLAAGAGWCVGKPGSGGASCMEVLEGVTPVYESDPVLGVTEAAGG